MSKIRICLAIETFFPQVGGSEKQALWLCQTLRDQGGEAYVLTLHWDPAWPVAESIDGVPVYRVAGRVLRWHRSGSALVRRVSYLLALLVLGYRLWQQRHTYNL